MFRRADARLLCLIVATGAATDPFVASTWLTLLLAAVGDHRRLLRARLPNKRLVVHCGSNGLACNVVFDMQMSC
ncbi:unnamed protein product [Closterium sp. Yama58-4]|nr:unnamed protein product [Closterium sp. Yama58-4]